MSITTNDKYDLAYDYLCAHPEEISDAWHDPSTHRAGCLFEFAYDRLKGPKPVEIGCITQIRHSHYVAATEALTLAIQADTRIPIPISITVEDLPIFAYWQRRIDTELGRE